MEICKRNGIERFQIVSERGDGASHHRREVVGSRRPAAIPGQGSELPSVFLQRGGLHRGGGRAGGIPSRAQEDSLPGFGTSGHASRDSRADRRKAAQGPRLPGCLVRRAGQAGVPPDARLRGESGPLSRKSWLPAPRPFWSR